MKHKTWIYVAIALFVGGLLTAMVVAYQSGYRPGGASQHPLAGRDAPSFRLPVVSGDGAGSAIELTALRGEVVVLDFWASWCRPCARSIPALNEIHAHFGERIRLYGVNVESNASADAVRAAHGRFGAEFPSLHDGDFAAQRAYQVANIPSLVLINRSGQVVAVHVGVPDSAEITDEIEALLN